MTHKRVTLRLGSHKLCRPHCGRKHRHYKAVGSRVQVWHGTAKRTTGGLLRKDLIKNRWGRIVSLEKHLLKKGQPLPIGFKEHKFAKKKGKRSTKKRTARSKASGKKRVTLR